MLAVDRNRVVGVKVVQGSPGVVICVVGVKVVQGSPGVVICVVVTHKSAGKTVVVAHRSTVETVSVVVV